MKKEKERLLSLIKRELDYKFRKGDKEHRGENIFELDLLNEAIGELYDGLIYLIALREKRYKL